MYPVAIKKHVPKEYIGGIPTAGRHYDTGTAMCVSKNFLPKAARLVMLNLRNRCLLGNQEFSAWMPMSGKVSMLQSKYYTHVIVFARRCVCHVCRCACTHTCSYEDLANGACCASCTCVYRVECKTTMRLTEECAPCRRCTCK